MVKAEPNSPRPSPMVAATVTANSGVLPSVLTAWRMSCHSDSSSGNPCRSRYASAVSRVPPNLSPATRRASASDIPRST